jgi:hypothetical protein
MPLTELEEVVLDDLTHLTAVLQNPDFRVAELRRASVTLASLLIDQGGILQKVAAARGLHILIRCPNNDDILEKVRGYARIYTSGCAKVGGMTLGAMYMLEGHQIPGLTKSSDQILHERQEVPLGKFKQQICAMWMGVVVTREEVIKYVANKLEVGTTTRGEEEIWR